MSSHAQQAQTLVEALPYIQKFTGKTIGEIIDGAAIQRPDVIHSIENPYNKTGGIAVLKGNIAPECSVVKESAVDPSMKVFSGPAKVYNSEDEALLVGIVVDGEVLAVSNSFRLYAEYS